MPATCTSPGRPVQKRPKKAQCGHNYGQEPQKTDKVKGIGTSVGLTGIHLGIQKCKPSTILSTQEVWLFRNVSLT